MKIWYIILAALAAFFLWTKFRTGTSTTGSNANAFTTAAQESPGLVQGSGTLQSSEAISYGSVPLQYAKSPVPNPVNVGVPIAAHTNYKAAIYQRTGPLVVKPTGRMAL